MFDQLNTKWDLRFLEMAAFVSKWSKDPSTKTGAVIVEPNRAVISTGYNGFAPGVNDSPEKYANRDDKYKKILHCERNSIMYGDRTRLKGSCIYLWPFLSCAPCAAMVIGAGIRRVVTKHHKPIDVTKENDPTRWEYDFKLAREQFSDAGVEVVMFPESTNFNVQDEWAVRGDVDTALMKLAVLKEDWDSYGAAPPSSLAIEVAQIYLDTTRIKPVKINPSAIGGVGITTRVGDKKAYYEIYNNGSACLLLSDGKDIKTYSVRVADAVHLTESYLNTCPG